MMIDRGSERSERDQPPDNGAGSRPPGPARAQRERPARTPDQAPDIRSRTAQDKPDLTAQERQNVASRAPEHSPDERHRERSRAGRRTYSVSAAERETMQEIGRFRVIRQDDLALYRYGSRTHESIADVRNLTRQGLLQKKTVWTGRDREEVTYLALTKAGKSYMKRHGEGLPQQAIYAGLVKPAELRHDAAIYPMFQKEAARIMAEGGHVGRVILDYELKKKAYSPLAKAKALPPDEYARRQAEIARQNGLKVVNGHIALPDLRIEYITRQGLAASVDLELATESYHGSHASEKAGAGFTIYAAADTAARLSAVLEEREISAEILSL